MDRVIVMGVCFIGAQVLGMLIAQKLKINPWYGAAAVGLAMIFRDKYIVLFGVIIYELVKTGYAVLLFAPLVLVVALAAVLQRAQKRAEAQVSQ